MKQLTKKKLDAKATKIRIINELAAQIAAKKQVTASMKFRGLFSKILVSDYCALPPLQRTLVATIFDLLNDDPKSSGNEETATRDFCQWVRIGLQLSDIEQISLKFLNTNDLPNTIDRGVAKEYAELMRALLNFRQVNQRLLGDEIKRRKVVDMQAWTACKRAQDAS